MAAIETFYTVGLHLLNAGLPLLSGGDGKLARGIRGRRESLARLAAWAAQSRDPSRPLAWFHAPSVGEGLQARAVIEALRETSPELQLAYTYFSPSAVAFAGNTPVDIADFLPLDLPAPVAHLFDALRPDAVVFTKTEVWPNVTREAARRGVPAALLSATLPASSSRLRGSARALLGPAHRRLARIAAISRADAERFAAFGVPADRISVMGDARFDQVWGRVRSPLSDPALLDALTDRTRVTIVAGSTWPPDEERLVAGFTALAVSVASSSPGEETGVRRPRLIIAPHEPDPVHIQGLTERLRTAGLSFALLGDTAGVATRPDVVVVDRVGVLGDLYRLADIAWVGGGFGNAGLHSVLEPAAFGAPVIFGPNHANSREAGELVAAGGAREITDEPGIEAVLSEWIGDADVRRRAGRIAKEYVEAGLGAAGRGAEIVRDLLSR